MAIFIKIVKVYCLSVFDLGHRSVAKYSYLLVFPVCIKLIILHCFFWSADHIFSSEVVWGLKYSYPEDFSLRKSDLCSLVDTGLYSVFEARSYSAAHASL